MKVEDELQEIQSAGKDNWGMTERMGEGGLTPYIIRADWLGVRCLSKMISLEAASTVLHKYTEHTRCSGRISASFRDDHQKVW